jgi:hypothetical protein
MTIHEFFSKDQVKLADLASHLDGLDEAARIAAVRELAGNEQAQLFEAAVSFRPLTLDDFVPADTAPLTEVIHYGRNSLPMFKIFQKRFCRAPDASELLWGYNHQTLAWLTGPGYFITRPREGGEILIDYLEVPGDKPATWPAIKGNAGGVSRFVYYQLQDVMRGVSRHVSIGRATRHGKNIDNWFVLCRQGE